jgi:hypothetical protein
MNYKQSADALKTAAKNIGSSAVIAYLVTVAPWVRLPVIYQIFAWFIKYIVGVAIDKTELGAFFLFIDMRTSQQGQAFADAALKNHEAQQSGTKEEKQVAEANLINKFRDLVKFTS